eukprot:TRINITY_DN3975_c0_g1_i2.p1 TRINITY_DN3975_c0_g1~~TRINITY_DN3975_c0_g1_i2.p1  ORF type:complete len:1038 (+),score=161.38 TRINITY_DN3975_c0_g1_i2:138-3251(+)
MSSPSPVQSTSPTPSTPPQEASKEKSDKKQVMIATSSTKAKDRAESPNAHKPKKSAKGSSVHMGRKSLRSTDDKQKKSRDFASLWQRLRKANWSLTDPERIAWLKTKSRNLCNNWRFTVLTTFLTIYALFGDDFRLAFTHKRTDDLFNTLTILALLVFSIEIAANSLGQEEYFLGFFFILDAGSTITLAFDLTWVSSALFCSGGDGDEALKTSRAGRAGARASRTVRIIRLMRLVRLYKAYRLAVEKKRQEQEEERQGKTVAPGEASQEYDWEKSEFEVNQDEDDENQEEGETGEDGKGKEDEQPKAEMRVGKKLSDMTTRRVIILVLVMLVCMPCFTLDGPVVGITEFRDSSNFGADMVYSRWRNWCGSWSGNKTWCFDSLQNSTEEHFQNRYELERSFLSFIYNHAGDTLFWQLYWIGASSTKYPMTGLGQMMRFNQADYIGIDRATAAELLHQRWESNYSGSGHACASKCAVELAPVVTERLVKVWREQCNGHVGVLLQPESRAESPIGCSIDGDLRCSEAEYTYANSITEDEVKEMSFVFVFDKRGATRLEAALSILQTIFICMAVGLGAMLFSKDANELLLNPIERMIEKMETIKDNPLEAMRLGDLEYRREEIEEARFRERLATMSRPWKVFYKYRHTKKSKEPMETVMLEKTIIKLGGLLALGFGEAGAEVIGQNMKGGATAGVNAMMPGSKVDVIIGFCNIRNFNDCTEVLKEKVMLFVNQVGEIVHGCVDDFHGAPNRNIGDAFLLVWRLSGSTSDRQTKLADMALMSYVKIIAEINKSRMLAVYREHPGLQMRVPGFRVQMGFGLHCGWAIEGAIGSEFKIDASYLSPNVNVSARLESATEQYKVYILLSHFMVNLCSQEMALCCRLIDHVTVKGSRQPIRLYTMDLDCCALKVSHPKLEKIIRNRFKIRQLREMRKSEKWLDDYHVWEAMDENEDIQIMRKPYSDEFFQRFAMAYRNYEAGEWLAARDMLFTCFYIPKSDLGRRLIQNEAAEWPQDGPTMTLVNFMRKYNFVPPRDWPGHRELTDK